MVTGVEQSSLQMRGELSAREHRINVLQEKIDAFYTDGKLETKKAALALATLTEKLVDTNPPKGKEKALLTDDLIAVLMSLKRADYLGPGKTFKRDFETQQLEAITTMLDGNFAKSRTGSGKSSVILPVTAIVHHLTAREPVFVATAQATLGSDLAGNIDGLCEKIADTLAGTGNRHLIAFWERHLRTFQHYHEGEGPPLPEGANALTQAALQPADPLLWAQANDLPITVTDFPSLVFNTVTKPKRYGNLPLVIADELDDIRSPFIIDESQKRKEKPILDVQDRESVAQAADHLIARCLYQFLIKDPQNFVYRDNKLQLSDLPGRQRISEFAIVLERYLGMTPITQAPETLAAYADTGSSQDASLIEAPSLNFPEIAPLVDGVLQEMTQIYSGVHEASGETVPPTAMSIAQHLRSYLQESLIKELAEKREELITQEELEESPDQESVVETYLRAHAEGLAEALNLTPGVDFIGSVDEIRDAYLGVPRVDHEYLSRARFYLGAIHNEPVLTKADKRSGHYIHFATWIHQVLGGRLVGCGANLSYKSPYTGKIEKTPFSRFLEMATGKKVIDLEANETAIPIPDPVVKEFDSCIQSMVEEVALRSGRPELIFCDSENDARKIQEQFVNRGIKTEIILSRETSEDKENEYYRQLASYSDTNPDGLRAVISTGRGRIGKDIKDAQGIHPNLHISYFGMPQDLRQLVQGFGRRRLPKSLEDYSWYLPSDQALGAISVLGEKAQRELLFFGRRTPSFAEAQNLITKASQLPLTQIERRQLRDVFLNILQTMERQAFGDYRRLITQELLWRQEIAPDLTKVKRGLFRTHRPPDLFTRVENEAEKLADEFQIPRATAVKIGLQLLSRLESHYAGLEEELIEQYYDDIFSHPDLLGIDPDKNRQTWHDLMKAIWSKRAAGRQEAPQGILSSALTDTINWRQTWIDELENPPASLRKAWEHIISESFAHNRQILELLRKEDVDLSTVEDFYLPVVPLLKPHPVMGNFIAVSQHIIPLLNSARITVEPWSYGQQRIYVEVEEPASEDTHAKEVTYLFTTLDNKGETADITTLTRLSANSPIEGLKDGAQFYLVDEVRMGREFFILNPPDINQRTSPEEPQPVTDPPEPMYFPVSGAENSSRMVLVYVRKSTPSLIESVEKYTP